jgi:hypothetical protein
VSDRARYVAQLRKLDDEELDDERHYLAAVMREPGGRSAGLAAAVRLRLLNVEQRQRTRTPEQIVSAIAATTGFDAVALVDPGRRPPHIAAARAAAMWAVHQSGGSLVAIADLFSRDRANVRGCLRLVENNSRLREIAEKAGS